MSIQFFCIITLVILSPMLMKSIGAIVCIVLGFIFGFYAIIPNPMNNFNIIPDIKEGATLIKTGAYKYVRHPMYFSVLLIMCGMLLEGISLIKIVLFSVLVVVLVLKAQKEEALWLQESVEYKEYMHKTKMIIPFVF